MIPVLASSLHTSLIRYRRSIGLWILLLVAPVGARFMIAPRGASQSLISVNNQIPWLTSEVLGMALGVVIATLALPAAFIYLRANVNKRQPWQVEEPVAAPRTAIAFGRWLADCAALAAVLAATTAAGLLLAVVLLPLNEVDPVAVVLPLWAIAAPPLAMVAALRVLFDARPWMRGPLGEVLFFVFWMGALIVPVAGMEAGGRHLGGFSANVVDLMGFISPIAYARGGDTNFAIGGGMIVNSGKVVILDVMSGVLAPGYLASRAVWLGASAVVALLAGVIYAPHVAGKIRRAPGFLKILGPGKAPAANPAARAARPAPLPWLGLLLAEIRLIASGRPMLLAMAAVAAIGAVAPWSGVAGPAAMLVLVFAATAHAGRSEQTGLLSLTRTGVNTPMARRLAFVLAGGVLTTLMAAGAIARGLFAGELRPLIEAPLLGLATALAAIALGAATRSATAPRLVLLIAWYAYLNWAGG